MLELEYSLESPRAYKQALWPSESVGWRVHERELAVWRLSGKYLPGRATACLEEDCYPPFDVRSLLRLAAARWGLVDKDRQLDVVCSASVVWGRGSVKPAGATIR